MFLVNGMRRLLGIVSSVLVVLVIGACSEGETGNGDGGLVQETPTLFELSVGEPLIVEPTVAVMPSALDSLDRNVVWTQIHERGIFDMRRYETRQEWEFTQDIVSVETNVPSRMRMRATVMIAIGMNLNNVQVNDIVADDANRSVTITLPQTQAIECFITDIEYVERLCVGADCGEIEEDLHEAAIRDVLGSEDFGVELDGAFEDTQIVVRGLIDELVNDYEIVFVKDRIAPPWVDRRSCD